MRPSPAPSRAYTAGLLWCMPALVMAGTVPLCELMKPTEVAAIAPFKMPLVKSEGWPMTSSSGGCRYAFESPDGERAGVAIGVTDLGTKANAQAHFTNTASAFKDLHGVEPQALTGLGDEASFCGEDETGLKIIRGGLVIDINQRGMYPEVTAEMKKQASISLAKLLLKRLEQPKLK